jgi:hypothetical protein
VGVKAAAPSATAAAAASESLRNIVISVSSAPEARLQ